MSRNSDYITGNLSGYLYHPNYYKHINIYLSRQTIMSISQKTNFVVKLKQDDGAKIFFIAEKQLKKF